MANTRLYAALALAACTTWQAAACSPTTDSGAAAGGLGAAAGAGNNGQGAGTGVAAGAGAGAVGGAAAGSGAGTGFGGGVIDLGAGATMNPNPKDASCGAVSAAPEQIIVYKDATVTDTTITTTYSPVALYIMQDRSGSMITGFPGGSAQSWANSTNALQAFVSDPQSAGLDVGLAFFPPTSNDTSPACDGKECGVPAVEIGPVKTTGPAIVTAMNSSQPQPLNFTPTECGLRGMIDHCIQYKQSSGEQCVGILITDGDPTTCDTNIANLSNIVAQGLQNGVTTFVIRLPGVTNPAGLDQVAAAGGTTAAIDVSGGANAFINALNAIRGKVSTSTQTSHQVTTQQVISTPLPCQWKIPAPPNGQNFDPNLVNLQFTPAGGTGSQFGFVPDLASCGSAPNAWYFDDPKTPTQVLLCPMSCDAVKASVGARIDLQFGCARKNVVPA